jgi:hypothetical protein
VAGDVQQRAIMFLRPADQQQRIIPLGGAVNCGGGHWAIKNIKFKGGPYFLKKRSKKLLFAVADLPPRRA